MEEQAKKKTAPIKESAPAYRRERLLRMERYQTRRDLLSVLLLPERAYTKKEADQLIEGFMAGKTAGKDGY